MNEVALFCNIGYMKMHAPYLWSPGVAAYLCVHHVLLAHARAYHLYQRDFRSRFGAGKISIALNSNFVFPRDPCDPEHVLAAERSNEFVVCI